MLDFTRIYCQVHPYELVTNFCSSDACYVGLCATCVGDHTQNHMQLGSKPVIGNIKTVHNRIHEDLKQSMSELESTKSKLNSLKTSIAISKQQLLMEIQKIRQSYIQTVNNYFDNYLKDVEETLEEHSRKTGFHDEARIQSLNNTLNYHILELIETSKIIHSKDFLNYMKQTKKRLLPQIQHQLCEINRQIINNQNYQTKIERNQAVYQDIKNLLTRSSILRFTLPNNVPNNAPIRPSSQYHQPTFGEEIIKQNNIISNLATQKSLVMSQIKDNGANSPFLIKENMPGKPTEIRYPVNISVNNAERSNSLMKRPRSAHNKGPNQLIFGGYQNPMFYSKPTATTPTNTLYANFPKTNFIIPKQQVNPQGLSRNIIIKPTTMISPFKNINTSNSRINYPSQQSTDGQKKRQGLSLFGKENAQRTQNGKLIYE